MNTVEYGQVNLFPRELYIGEKPTVVWAVLGSCLAVVCHNKHHRIGAICHAQLAESLHTSHTCSDYCPHPCFTAISSQNPFKFVSCSIRYMVEYFSQKNIASKDIDVKLFGGASTLPGLQLTRTVGEQNIEVAYKIIEQYRLNLISKHIGGRTGRTLYFYSDTGEVFVKSHKSSGSNSA